MKLWITIIILNPENNLERRLNLIVQKEQDEAESYCHQFFWDAKAILLVDCLQAGKTII